MKRLLTWVMLLCATMATLHAEDYPTITINGVKLDKMVTRINITPTRTTIVYEDQTTEQVFTETLSVIVDDETPVEEMRIYGGVELQGGNLTATGLQEKAQAAIYDLSGKRLMQARVRNGQVKMDVQRLSRGTYILKCDKTVVKFLKK